MKNVLLIAAALTAIANIAAADKICAVQTTDADGSLAFIMLDETTLLTQPCAAAVELRHWTNVLNARHDDGTANAVLAKVVQIVPATDAHIGS